MPAKATKVRRARRAPQTSEAAGWSLVIHGGAGAALVDVLDARREAAVRAALHDVLEAGAKALASGATSVAVVEDAVRRLEDCPLFNAGKGAVFNARGEHELEASIMDGRTLASGAAANLRGIKNPVVLARRVMERTPHVFLQGDGAIALALAEGMQLETPAYFWTEERWNALKQARLHGAVDRAPGELGTVGAVARDQHGNLAAATSTGGLTNKLPGRVADSSIIGAGTYASNASCAVSCTGQGDYFIRAAAAHDVCARVEYAGDDARTAATAVLARVRTLGGDGGMIVVGRDGSTACVFSTEIMYRGAVTHATQSAIAIRAGEPP